MSIWHEILEVARFAPSPHNVQPWKFRITGEASALLLIDRSRTLPKEDFTGSFILSAMAMMTEAMTIVAANRQHRLDIKVIHDGDFNTKDLIPYAELHLTPAPAAVSEYEDRLFHARRTSRLSYQKKNIPQQNLQVLKTLSERFGHIFNSTGDRARINRLMGWNIESVFYDLGDPDYHGEISGYFRYTDAMIKRHRDGLDYKCMNHQGVELWMIAKARWLLKIPLLGTLMKWNYSRKLGHTQTIGWLAGRFWAPEDSIEAGRLLMRFWLETAKLGIYFHPLGNLVTNKLSYSRISHELAPDIWLIFRIGYTPEPVQSQRLSVQEIIIA